MSAIFGGSKSKSQQTAQSQSSSSNQAYPWLQATYGPQAQGGLDAMSAYKSLLGLGDTPHAYDDAFNKYKDSTGYDFMFDQGQRAITGSAAARGMLNSGATLKALTKYGQDTASTKFYEYLDRLLGQGNQSLQIGNLIGGAGGVSSSTGSSSGTSTSSSSPGIAGALGTALSFLPK